MSSCAKFKVGDRVVGKGVVDGANIEDQVGTIVEIDKYNKGEHLVKFDLEFDFDISQSNNMWYCYQDFLELVERQYTLKKFEKDIRKFNERCGNKAATKDSSLQEVCELLLPQAKVIMEEAKELLKATEEQNELEILDGAVDVLVTSLRLISLLKDKYDLMGAAKTVMENNHLKYTQDLDETMFDEKWSVAGTKVIYTKVNDQHYYCLKDENGKIRKWNGFPKVDLSQFLVKGGE